MWTSVILTGTIIDDPMFPTLHVEQGDEETDGQSHSETDPVPESGTTPEVEVCRSSRMSHPPGRYRPNWS